MLPLLGRSVILVCLSALDRCVKSKQASLLARLIMGDFVIKLHLIAVLGCSFVLQQRGFIWLRKEDSLCEHGLTWAPDGITLRVLSRIRGAWLNLSGNMCLRIMNNLRVFLRVIRALDK